MDPAGNIWVHSYGIDTLFCCAPNRSLIAYPLKGDYKKVNWWQQISFPEPVISLAIAPKTKSDQEKLSYVLQRLAEEDPTFIVKLDHDTSQAIISGMR